MTRCYISSSESQSLSSRNCEELFNVYRTQALLPFPLYLLLPLLPSQQSSSETKQTNVFLCHLSTFHMQSKLLRKLHTTRTLIFAGMRYVYIRATASREQCEVEPQRAHRGTLDHRTGKDERRLAG